LKIEGSNEEVCEPVALLRSMLYLLKGVGLVDGVRETRRRAPINLTSSKSDEFIVSRF
jgi:hypothetical protein